VLAEGRDSSHSAQYASDFEPADANSDGDEAGTARAAGEGATGPGSDDEYDGDVVRGTAGDEDASAEGLRTPRAVGANDDSDDSQSYSDDSCVALDADEGGGGAVDQAVVGTSAGGPTGDRDVSAGDGVAPSSAGVAASLVERRRQGQRRYLGKWRLVYVGVDASSHPRRRAAAPSAADDASGRPSTADLSAAAASSNACADLVVVGVALGRAGVRRDRLLSRLTDALAALRTFVRVFRRRSVFARLARVRRRVAGRLLVRWAWRSLRQRWARRRQLLLCRVHIQRFFRALYQRRCSSAVQLQRVWRGSKGRAAAATARAARAATRVARWHRGRRVLAWVATARCAGRILRLLRRTYRRRAAVAARVQRWWRVQLLHRRRRQLWATALLSRVCGGWWRARVLARLLAQRRVASATIARALARNVRVAHRRRRVCAGLLQRAWRRHCLVIAARRAAATLLLRWLRHERLAAWLRPLSRAAMTLQRWWRLVVPAMRQQAAAVAAAAIAHSTAVVRRGVWRWVSWWQRRRRCVKALMVFVATRRIAVSTAVASLERCAAAVVVQRWWRAMDDDDDDSDGGRNAPEDGDVDDVDWFLSGDDDSDGVDGVATGQSECAGEGHSEGDGDDVWAARSSHTTVDEAPIDAPPHAIEDQRDFAMARRLALLDSGSSSSFGARGARRWSAAAAAAASTVTSGAASAVTASATAAPAASAVRSRRRVAVAEPRREQGPDARRGRAVPRRAVCQPAAAAAAAGAEALHDRRAGPVDATADGSHAPAVRRRRRRSKRRRRLVPAHLLGVHPATAAAAVPLHALGMRAGPLFRQLASNPLPRSSLVGAAPAEFPGLLKRRVSMPAALPPRL
jgi:hypothetical protein